MATDKLTVREEEQLKEAVAAIDKVAAPLARVPKMLPSFMCRFLHPTIQQNFTRLCVAWLTHLSTIEDGRYDMRTADSVALGREFVAKVDENKRYLSYI